MYWGGFSNWLCNPYPQKDRKAIPTLPFTVFRNSTSNKDFPVRGNSSRSRPSESSESDFVRKNLIPWLVPTRAFLKSSVLFVMVKMWGECQQLIWFDAEFNGETVYQNIFYFLKFIGTCWLLEEESTWNAELFVQSLRKQCGFCTCGGKVRVANTNELERALSPKVATSTHVPKKNWMKGVTHRGIHQGTVSTPCASWIDFVWFPEFLVRFRRRTRKSISRRFKLAKNIKIYLNNMSCKTHGMGHCQWLFLPWYLIAPFAASLVPTSIANQDPRAKQTNLITFSWFQYLRMDLCLIHGPVRIMKCKYGFHPKDFCKKHGDHRMFLVKVNEDSMKNFEHILATPRGKRAIEAPAEVDRCDTCDEFHL